LVGTDMDTRQGTGSDGKIDPVAALAQALDTELAGVGVIQQGVIGNLCPSKFEP
jgi:hypothetical protein